MALLARKANEIIQRHVSGPHAQRIILDRFEDPTTQRVRMARRGDYSFTGGMRNKDAVTLRSKINMLAGITILSEQLQKILADIQREQTIYDARAAKEHSVANKLLKALNEAGVIKIRKVILANERTARIILTEVNIEKLARCIKERKIIFD